MSREVSLIVLFRLAAVIQGTIFGSSETHFEPEAFIDKSYENT